MAFSTIYSIAVPPGIFGRLPPCDVGSVGNASLPNDADLVDQAWNMLEDLRTIKDTVPTPATTDLSTLSGGATGWNVLCVLNACCVSFCIFTSDLNFTESIS